MGGGGVGVGGEVGVYRVVDGALQEPREPSQIRLGLQKAIHVEFFP